MSSALKEASEEAPTPRRGTGGRPSRAEASRRDQRLVDVAAALFMERGFDNTTMDAVADAAGIGKATLYARYRDKGALFAAVLKAAVDRGMASLGDIASVAAEGGDLRVALLTVARALVARSISPEAIMLKRTVVAQTSRFPELAQLIHTEGWQRANAAIADLLARFDGLADLRYASDFFLSLVIGRQTQRAMFGIATDPQDLDARIVAAVDFFLVGLERGGVPGSLRR